MRPLTICLLVALFLRLAFVVLGFPVLASRWHLREDGDNYGLLAQSVRAGHYEDVARGPVYPCLVAAAGSPLAVKILQAFLDTATVALIWWLAVSVTSAPERSRLPVAPLIGLLAAWLWAVYPLAIWRVAFINKEVVLAFLLAGYACLQLRAIAKGRTVLWLAAGALLGLINLCKPTFLLWPVVIAAFAWRRRIPVGRFVVFVLATILVIAPWTYRNYRVTNGAWLPVATEMGGRTTFVGNYQPSLGLWEGPGRPRWTAAVQEIERQHAGASVVELDRAFYRAAWEQVAAHPFRAVVLALRKCGRFWFLGAARREQAAGILVQGVYLILALVGLWWLAVSGAERTGPAPQLRKAGSEPGLGLLVALACYVMAVPALSYADIRFSLPAMPVVSVLAAAGLGALIAGRQRRRTGLSQVP